MGLADDIRAKINEAELDKQLRQVADEAQQLFDKGAAQAGDLAHDKRADVDEWLAKAEAQVNTRTEGQYADTVAKVRRGLMQGLDAVAARRTPEPPADPDEIAGPPTPEA